MRTMSATLLAATTSGRGRPWVSLDVEDHRSRWSRHVSGAASTRRTDLGLMDGDLVRVSLVGSQIRWARLTDPSSPSQWPGTWQAIAGDADGSEDVTLAVYSATRASVFYARNTGHLARVDTADGGVTWGASEACCAWDYTPVWVAADGVVCAWSRPGEIRLATTRDDLGNPAWVANVLYGGAGPFVHCHGLALCRDHADPTTYYLVSAIEGALLITTYHQPSQIFGRTYQIIPPGTAGAASTSQVREPSVTSTADGLYVTYIDKVGVGDLAHWEQVAALHTRHYPHFARVALLDMGQSTPARAALACHAEAVYAACENNACRSLYYLPDRMGLNTRNLMPAAYTVRTTEQSSTVTIVLPNVGHAYDAAGQSGTPYEALRPGATLLLHRGYVTTSGPEAITLAPHTVTEVRLHAGRERNVLQLFAVGALDLLRAQHLADVCQWRDETIRHLLAQVCGMAGLSYADGGEDALGATLDEFVLRPVDTLAGGMRALLGLAAAVAYVDASGALQARVLSDYAPDAVTLGQGGELLQREVIARAPELVASAVYGDGAAASSAADTHTMDTGLLLTGQRVDYRATTHDLAATLAEYAANRATMARQAVRFLLPVRPDLEMWDRVELDTDDVRRVVALEERYDARRGLYQTTLEVQG